MLSCDCDFILLINSLECSLFSSGCCKSVTLFFTGAAARFEKWPKYLGSYEVTGEEHEGSGGEEHEGEVYSNSDGIYLYRHSDGRWRVGGMVDGRIGFSGNIWSVGTAECPASISQWQYLADFNWHSGDITIDCN